MYKPILFNTQMVRAILKSQKTQTRRIIKPQPSNPRWNNIGWLGWDDGHGCRMKPPCEKGDILWVREAWCDPNLENPFAPLAYKADFPMHWDADQTEHGEPVTISAEEMKWRPSIHMPKEAARIFLRIKDVRIELLQAMDEEAAIAEGFADSPAGAGSPLMRFVELWDKTIKRGDLREFGYHANPWVWVIEFERCEKPEGWCE